ncbi:MAG: hypothetical protein IT385_28900 [Deltaproteobacteria bacterium]|nr:hypothetical protein [Deltaproteobacteria bacterium]
MRLTSADLEARIRARCPHALLVEERLVRRAVREDRGITGVRTFVPHTHVYALTQKVLAASIKAEELGLAPPVGDWVLLVPRPDDEFEGDEVEAILLDTWRHLFHARIDEELGRQIADGRLDRVRVLELIDRIGQLPMDEARAVIEDEGLTGPGADDARALVELVALHAELRFFDPPLLARYFPSLAGRDDIAPLFDGLVPAAAVFEATRLDGAPDPATRVAARRAKAGAGDDEDDGRPKWRVRGLIDAARRATHHARDIDAATAAWKARQIAPPGGPEHAEATAHQAEALARLGRRLHALHPGGDSADEWAPALEALLPRARWGMARVEARLLHDLERACDDTEQPAWDIDLGRFIRSFGRAPIRRQESVRQRVAVARHLLRAQRRLVAARIPDADRRRLERLIGGLARAIETRVRDEVGALLRRALAAAGLAPDNLPERVAEAKVVAELCDKMLDRGFIAFGDLRDLIARNQLKLADLRGPGEWLLGDQLLRLDRQCAATLDAAYRKAEVYRRAFHRLSSVLFANVVGRLLVRFALLPALGAFILVEGFDHTVMAVLGWIFGGSPHISSVPLLVGTTVFLFALIHSDAVRRWTVRALKAVGRGLSFFLSDLPELLRELPPIAALRRTRAWQVFREHVWRPALFAVWPTLVVVIAAHDSRLWAYVGLPLAAAISIWFATRRGARFAERTRDWLVVAWHHIRHELVPGLIAAVLDLFKRVVDKVEIVLYVVDQWLRYRRGDSTFGLIVKALFGFVWSIIAYTVRLSVSLVAEPQLNPIKHFPVVTVTHKVTLPASAFVAQELTASMGPAWGNFLGLGVFQLAVPGIAGFLVWEFKENWRLYAKNRQPHLRPAIVGSHGEPVYRLLRPGFHSGTIPTLFRKLRRAERRGRGHEVRRFTEELHHVEEALERFVLRELKTPLVLSGRFAGAESIEVAHVRLTPARIAIEIVDGGDAPPFELAFEEQARFLVANVVNAGWVEGLDPERRALFEGALLGIYKLSGVDLVREQIATVLPERARYDIGARGLVVWPGPTPESGVLKSDFATEIVYPLRLDNALIEPDIRGARPEPPPRPITVSDIAFKRRVVTWPRWTAAWNGGGMVQILDGRPLIAAGARDGDRASG